MLDGESGDILGLIYHLTSKEHLRKGPFTFEWWLRTASHAPVLFGYNKLFRSSVVSFFVCHVTSHDFVM